KPWHVGSPCRSRDPTLKERGISDLRCSRPLCSSQSTGGTNPRLACSVRSNLDSHEKVLRLVCLRGDATGPSGPNSVHAPELPFRSVPFPEGKYWDLEVHLEA